MSGDRIRRFLKPRSVAVVGASERQVRASNAITPMLDADLDLYLVNPNRDEAFGRKTYPSVAEIGKPVDAVLCLVSAELAVDVVAEAAAADVGGCVVIAGGFAEAATEEGAELQRRLAANAGGMPLLGPNCNGFVRPESGVRLSGAPSLAMPAGPIGLITQSGALMAHFGLAAQERGLGLSTVITTGNELVLDLAACLDFLVEDPETRVIGLVVEGVRDPEAFFAAAGRAADAGKPVVALKLGRSARGSEIATSHTGAMAGDPKIYQAVFRQHGIAWANEVDDLFDRMALLAQLPPERWSAVSGLGVLSGSGGWASMTSDLCEEEGIELPALADKREEVSAIVPDRTVVNPLDMTGFVQDKPEVVSALADFFLDSGEIDALLLYWFINEGAEKAGQWVIEPAKQAAQRSRIPVVISSLTTVPAGEWARQISAESEVAIGRGAKGTIAGLRTMRDHVLFRQRDRGAASPADPIPAPGGEVIESSVGPILGFGAVMELLAAAGIPTAPYQLLGSEEEPALERIPFEGPYVLKLADVPHRTELGAVRVGIPAEEVPEIVRSLREVAARNGVPATLAIQPMLSFDSEFFIGGELEGELGPLLLCGLGGVLVEALGGSLGRLVPLSPADQKDLLDELAGAGVFAGLRGSRPWDREEVGRLLTAASSLALGAESWLASFDLNPLVSTPEGLLAVDGLFLLKQERGA